MLHAVTDALLGAAALGDIGDAYPDTDPRWKDADSRLFLTETLAKLNQLGWRVVNLDVTIFAQEPKLGPVKAAIRESLAALLGVPRGRGEREGEDRREGRAHRPRRGHRLPRGRVD